MNGYRKMSICAIYLLISAAFLMAGMLDGETWMKYTSVAVGGFMGANLFEHVGSKK